MSKPAGHSQPVSILQGGYEVNRGDDNRDGGQAGEKAEDGGERGDHYLETGIREDSSFLGDDGVGGQSAGGRDLFAGGNRSSYEGVEVVELLSGDGFCKEAYENASQGAGGKVKDHLPGQVDFRAGGPLHYASEGLCCRAASYE